jgi:quinol monooxygenase YgiN
MASKLPMIVTFEFEENQIDYMKGELLKILEPTRKEDGCILYELHQDLDNPSIFMFYEIWDTKEAWMAHDTKPHIVKFKEILGKSNTKVTVNKLKFV